MKKIIVLAGITALIGVALPTSNALAGAEAKCKACHSFDSTHKVGPGLAGVFGREAGGTDFSKYSDALKGGGWVWNEENLRKYLADSKEAVKELTGDDDAKTKMPPQKLKGDKLDEVITFLKELK